jgi:uncharacterized protein
MFTSSPGEDIGEKEITAVDKEELEKKMKETIGIMETGGVGYIGGFPTGKIANEKGKHLNLLKNGDENVKK